MASDAGNAMQDRPGADAGAASSLTAEALWDTLTADPQVGVGILTIDGELRYANDQAARFFLGPEATARPYIGQNLRSFFPLPLVKDRIAIMEKMRDTGRPVALRGIWNGRQHLTLIRKIEGEPGEPGEVGASDAPEQFLFILHPMQGDSPSEPLADGSKYEFVESPVIELGPLDALTARELEVLALIGRGLSLKEIAATLYRTVKTVEKHRAAIGAKLAAHDRVALAEIARRAGLTTRDAARERV